MTPVSNEVDLTNLPACFESEETAQLSCEADFSHDTPLYAAATSQALRFDVDSIEAAEPYEHISTPAIPEDVWVRIRNQLTFDVPDTRRVNVQKDWYLRHPAYMKRVAKRAEPFLFLIVEEIEKQEMPLELALLPIVESAFDPFAYSHGRAAGMWQFIPGTGKRFGMKQTWWYDGRRDVLASTQGAIDYMNYLRDYFDGDWLHALAAYNSGEGRVKKAIRKNKAAGKPTDFWSLDLPRETRAYVPKLLALSDILSNSEDYEFEWPTIANAPATQPVETGSQIDLAYAAQLADMTVDELHALNPGFNRWATDPAGPHRLLLPIDKVENFTRNLDDIEENQRLNWVRHKVKSGDSLLKIAKKYHTTVDIIQDVNEMGGNMIRVGDHLMVPVALKSLDAYSLSEDQRLASTQSKKRGAYQLTHKVKSGDTMWDLSREYNVNVRSLAKWNGMAPTDPLMLGKKLVIWVNQVSTEQRENAIMRSLTYTVRNGDSLARIAGKFNVKISDLKKWNQLDPKKYLQPGQKLKLYVDVTRT